MHRGLGTSVHFLCLPLPPTLSDRLGTSKRAFIELVGKALDAETSPFHHRQRIAIITDRSWGQTMDSQNKSLTIRMSGGRAMPSAATSQGPASLRRQSGLCTRLADRAKSRNEMGAMMRRATPRSSCQDIKTMPTGLHSKKSADSIL